MRGSASVLQRLLLPQFLFNFARPPRRSQIEAMSGALLPFGDRSFRSATLRMLVELFAGPLVGATYCDTNGDVDWGAFICAFRLDILGDANTICKEASRLLSIVRNYAVDEKVEIRLPGDRAKKHEASVNRTKTILVERVVAELLGLSEVVG